jgi:putative tryptophan/tyrosine transport system substrate-binding protein
MTIVRSALLAVLFYVLVTPLAAEAQAPGKVYRVGYLSMAPGPSPRSEALQQGLRDLGYVEGQNIAMEYRWADGKLDRAQSGAAELVRAKVDVIVTGGPQTTRVAKDATTTVPIVMAVDYDPVGAGFVASLARPGANITGLSAINPQLSGKRLELLKAAVTRLSRIAVLWNSAEPNSESYVRETQVAARALGVQVQSLEIRSVQDLERAFRAATKEHANALAVLTDPVTLYNRTELASLAAKHRLPAIYSERLFVEAGGLMSYGASDRDLHRRAAVFVDKILKGAKPSDLPVEQPTKYEFVIGLKTAKALGLAIPPALLARADEIIQ